MPEALKLKAAVAVEDLGGLLHRVSQKSNTLASKLSRFAYRKLLEVIETKCVELNVPLIYVKPKDTSSICPKCNSELYYMHRLAYCMKCGFIADRDVIGAMNIYRHAFLTLSRRRDQRGLT